MTRCVRERDEFGDGGGVDLRSVWAGWPTASGRGQGIRNLHWGSAKFILTILGSAVLAVLSPQEDSLATCRVMRFGISQIRALASSLEDHHESGPMCENRALRNAHVQLGSRPC